jgi:hypothetical protein
MVLRASRLPGGRVENSKFEIRNPKSAGGREIRNPKSEIRNSEWAAVGIPNSEFIIPNS